MIKRLLTPLLIFTTLYAEESEEVQPLDPEVLQSLYIESALFVAVFTTMAIISIVISKKHAAQNLLDDREKREAKKIEEAKKRSQSASMAKPEETKRVTELSKMLKDGLISNEEFKLLSKGKSD